MKIDKFTAVVIGIVVLLLVAAVVTVNRTGREAGAQAEYLPTDTPEAPVHNAFLALQRGDIFKAREQYAARILDEDNPDYAYGPLSATGGRYDMADNARRLRILSAEIDEKNPDHAVVTFVQDTYSNSGPFGAGQVWSSQRAIEVIYEDGAWKINAPEFFY